MTTTDDESSSTTSFRPRPRQLSKPSAMPSPLGSSSSNNNHNHNYNKGNGSSLALSSFSFLSSSDKSSSNFPHLNEGNHPYGHSDSNTNNSSSNTHAALSLPSTTQLRVRHLERNSTYAGYLTKFSSRTFFSRKQWKRRYFILSQKSLHCFKSSDPQHPLLESINLSPDTIICVTDMFAGKRFCLQISCPGEKNWYVLADTATEMSGWLRELKGTVQLVRTLQIDSRPPTLYSETSEISEMSSASGLRGVPHVPAIPSHYDAIDAHSRLHPGTLLPSSRHGGPTSPSPYYSAQGSLDAYGQAKSLSPPPRPITPKPSTPTPGSVPQHHHQNQHQRAHGSMQVSHAHGQNHGSLALPSISDPMPVPEPRRRRNSSLSSGQPATDYASFGSVMARAEALAEAQKEKPSSAWSIPPKYEGGGGSSATLPRSKRDSTLSTMSSMSSASRMSIMADRNEALASVPHRSAQRLMGSPSRPMSPVTSRPLSPSMTRTSPRSSLVISPPPRSIHRPASVAIRHSTQILSPPHIITAGLSSQNPSDSPLSSNPPTSSLPATPDSVGSNHQLMYSGSLSRITNLRQRDMPSNRQSMISLSSNHAGVVTGTGSLQERVQRNSARTSIMRPSMSPVAVGGQSPLKSAADWTQSSRPLSPTPSLASAPTLPLPQPPRSNSSSPSKEPTPSIASTSSQSSVATSQSHSSEQASRRISTVPRHHEPDLTIPHRSKARSRSGSQEAAVLVSKLNEVQLTRKAGNPSPRLSAVITPSQVSSPTSSPSVSESGHRHLRQMSLPLQSMYVLPDPPTREAPVHPTSAISPTPSRPLKQRSAGSSGTLRPLSSVVGQQIPSLGGGIARRSSNASATLPGGSNRDSIVRTGSGSSGGSHRHSIQIVPLQTVLPAPPTTALPSKPNEPSEDKKEKKISAHQATPSATSTATTGTSFGAILEEEEEEDEEDEDEDEDEDESEFGTSLQFEELEAVKQQSTEQDIDQDSTATTPTTSLGTRPEYYATKERTVVEYIFPSEAFPV
ncbi:hypothetical protein BGZ95_010117 [Linnemannia exigua]|uniref:PH domain-containing protein n=1 Tax=Linnemannia exigua TaxID=604196 RepID=A0AAD4DDI8_9FUNG|nr:hypothetical protein BGZ95_010117 [Linnemannia exigua]